MKINYVINKDGSVQQGISSIPVVGKVDVVVAGGGTAGVVAAIAAARNKAKTLLVEVTGALGGTGSSAMMSVFTGSSWATGLSAEVIERLIKAGGAPAWNESVDRLPFDPLGRGTDRMNRSQSTPFDPELYKEITLEMTLEAGVEHLFYSLVSDAIVENDVVKGIIVENKGGRQAILADVVIDCTGDGDVAVKAGAQYCVGDKNSKMRPISQLFRLGGLDLKVLYQWAQEHPDQIQPLYQSGQLLEVNGEHVAARISGFYDFCERAQERGELSKEIHYIRFEDAWIERGVSLINSTRVYDVDGTNPSDISKTILTARKQVRQLVRFIRKYLPGCRNAFLIDVAPSLGVRETRHIIGEYFLTSEDEYHDAKFADAIMSIRRYFPKRGLPDTVEAHPIQPIEGSKDDPYERAPTSIPVEPHTYQVPYRVLLPKGVKNMLLAGRCISVDHKVDSTVRNQLICMRMGQVAGTAAALAVRERRSPNTIIMDELRSLLIKQGLTDLDEK